MEDKQNICDALLKAVQLTRAGSDIVYLAVLHDQDEEYVNIIYGNGYHKKVNVTADSGVSMIRDVLREIN